MANYNENHPSNEGLRNPNLRIGLEFIKWGFWLFLFGIFIGFGIVGHYLMGSKYTVGDDFLNNVTLWFGSPLMYSSGFIQIGGLGMAILGFIYLKVAKFFPNYRVEDKDKTALVMAIAGLVGLFLTGYIGYFIIDRMYPGFYYLPIDEGKNIWLVLQALSSLIYLLGLVIGFGNLHSTICEYYHKDKDLKR